MCRRGGGVMDSIHTIQVQYLHLCSRIRLHHECLHSWIHLLSVRWKLHNQPRMTSRQWMALNGPGLLTGSVFRWLVHSTIITDTTNRNMSFGISQVMVYPASVSFIPNYLLTSESGVVKGLESFVRRQKQGHM